MKGLNAPRLVIGSALVALSSIGTVFAETIEKEKQSQEDALEELEDLDIEN